MTFPRSECIAKNRYQRIVTKFAIMHDEGTEHPAML